MFRSIRPLLFAAPMLLLALGSFAQPKTFTVKESLTSTALQPVAPRQLQWCQAGDWFAWVQPGPEELWRQNAKTGKKEKMLTPQQLDKDMKRFPLLHWTSENRFWWQQRNEVLAYDHLTKKASTLLTYDEHGEDTDLEPTTMAVAYTKGQGLYIHKGQQVITVATETAPGIALGKSVHRNEFGIKKGTFWSPKGGKLAFYRMDESMVTEYPLVDLTPYPAKAEPIRYPMAGQRSHHVTLGVYDLASQKTIYVKTGQPEDQYLTNISWSPDERFVFIAVLNREQDHMRLNQYDAATGTYIKTLFEERHPKYVEPESPMEFLTDGSNRFIWQSEREGFNHLYLYSMEGTLLRTISKGNDPVVETHGFVAGGKVLVYELATNNGLDRQFMAYNLVTGSTTKITAESGTHVAALNPTGTWALDVYSNVNTPRVGKLINLAGNKVTPLYEAANPLKDYNGTQTELISLKAADGTPLNARMVRPANFEPGKKYPAIVYVYGGPHAQMVTNSWLGGGNLWFHHLAQQGFVVFTLDNRGSAHRGLAFENATYRKLGTVEAQDQMVGIDHLFSLPFVDTARIGVHGWSFGGFMTTNLMTRHPNIFKVGVAGGPVIDWAMYEVMYTERYMDAPADNPEGYENASLLNRVKDLRGKLLMIHGSADDVVVWQHSQLFVKECVEEGVHLDYFVYPGHKHNVIGKDRVHLLEKITGYFKMHL